MTSINVSVRTAALLALSQDICALISITLETSLSTLNFLYRLLLSWFFLERKVKFDGNRTAKAESGRGCAIVVLGANEAAGQSLTLHLAKIGYTVFPLIPLPSPTSNSPPTSSALTHLLLTWSGVQKRLRARYPDHSGGVVPVIIDPECHSGDLSSAQKGDLKKHKLQIDQPQEEEEEGRFSHAGETVRAYCKENKLVLVSVICTSRDLKSTKGVMDGGNSNDNLYERSGSSDGEVTNNPFNTSSASSSMQRSSSAPSTSGSVATLVNHTPPIPNLIKQGENHVSLGSNSTNTAVTAPTIATAPTIPLPKPLPIQPPKLPYTSLTLTPEPDLISLYRSNILDPLSITRELHDLLAIPCTKGWSKGRIIFINGEKNGKIVELNNHNYIEDEIVRNKKVNEFIDSAKKNMINLVRDEMGEIGVEVCEVVVGPMSPRIGTTGYHLRQSSEDSNQAASAILGDTLKGKSTVSLKGSQDMDKSREAFISSTYQFLNRFWAVDDALLFSSVRRSIEDPYNRKIHRAGLSPFIDHLIQSIPFKIGIKIRNLIFGYLNLVLSVYWFIICHDDQLGSGNGKEGPVKGV